MKKLFTIAAAVLASVSIWAIKVPTATLNPADVPDEGWAGKYDPAYIENGDWVCFSPYEVYQSIATGQNWADKDNSGSTDGTWNATAPFPASSAWTKTDGKVATVREGQKGPYYYRITNTTEVAALVKSGSDKKRTIFMEAYELAAGVAPATATKSTSMESSTAAVISLTELDKDKEYVIVVRQEDTGTGGSSGGNSNYYAIGFKTIMSTDPILKVSAESVNLEVTSVEANPSVKVKFSGKNLAEGNYDLTVPTVDGLTITPTSVSVGADGKLSAEVTIAYASATDVAAASANLSLTIGALTKTVAINYSASHAKDYASSLNIEQWILDNGKNDAAFAAVVSAAHIDFSASNGLDSRQDADKENRNEAFLGLKLKKKDITIKFWLEKGKALNVKFGNQTKAVNVTIDETAQTPIAANAKALALAADDVNDRLITLTTTDDATVVIKQIMIGEDIAEVTLPAQVEFKVTCADAEHGTVKVGTKTTVWIAKGETVTLTLNPEDGYKVASVTVNGDPVEAVADVYSFVMPAANANVAATFDVATAIDNAEVSGKAVKVIENGQMIIIKNGVKYDLTGSVIR